jgi:uroporphyrinogen-III synthase/uroporphyrinogen III methyltransferase/synthase
MGALPLAGRRVLVTRAAHQAGKLSDGLRALGAEPVEVPVLEIRPPAGYDAIDLALRRLDSYDWLILTSANTVRAFAERAADLGLLLAPQGRFKVAAIGEATADAARKRGLPVTLIPGAYVAEAMVEALAKQARGQKFLLARAEVARDVIVDALRNVGAKVDVVDAYRNLMPEAAPALLRKALQQPIDAVTFTSSSSVTHLAEAAEQAGIPFPFAGVPAISIGPITSRTLRELGWEPAAEASPSEIPALVNAVVLALEKSLPKKKPAEA